MFHLPIILALLCFLLSLGISAASLLRKERQLGKIGYAIFIVAVLLNLVFAVLLFLADSNAIFSAAQADYYFLIALFSGIIGATVLTRYPSQLLTLLISLITSFFLIGSSYLAHFAPSSENGVPLHVLILHVLPSLIADICILIAFIAGMVYLVQEKRLKQKKQLLLDEALPSLEVLEKTRSSSVFYAFSFLSVSVFSGTYSLVTRESAETSRSLLDLTMILLVLVWSVLFFLVSSKQISLLGARRANLLTVVSLGTFILALAFAFVMGRGMHGL